VPESEHPAARASGTTPVLPLAARLAARIRVSGPVDFEAFMAAALYDPDGGYYHRGRLEQLADFRTAPEVHPAFGQLLARQAAEMLRRLPRRGPRRIVELGPGSGALAAAMLPVLAVDPGIEAPDWEYHLVEVSPRLREVQRRRLAELPEALAARARWSDPAELAAEPADGVVVANEFFDALPVRRARVVAGTLREVRVGWEEKAGFLEEDDQPAPAELAAYLERYGAPLAEGQTAELSLETLRWVDRVAGMLLHGYVVVIDYGHPAEGLYAAARAHGTLLAYHEHRAGGDPLTRIGEQDLTAHVNFTALARRASESGFEPAPLRTQTQFLLGLGILELLAEAAAAATSTVDRIRSRSAITELFAPGGMGETFKVLLLARGAPLGSLSGLGSPWEIDSGLPGATA
jgi:SAM-dependent MidA family methyltransferase